MVYFHSSISVCNSVDHSVNRMANPVNSDLCSKTRQGNPTPKYRRGIGLVNCSNFPVCDGSGSALVDVVILIAVICACGVLLFPSFKFVTLNSIEIFSVLYHAVQDEIVMNPFIYGSIGLGTFGAAIASWIMILRVTRKCGNSKCKGLRKSPEFDIQLETEECIRNSSFPNVKDAANGRLFELPLDQHRELEAELKRMAPPNGRAVLVFKARCGCSVGRLEVPGPRKIKKIKKIGS